VLVFLSGQTVNAAGEKPFTQVLAEGQGGFPGGDFGDTVRGPRSTPPGGDRSFDSTCVGGAWPGAARQTDDGGPEAVSGDGKLFGKVIAVGGRGDFSVPGVESTQTNPPHAMDWGPGDRAFAAGLVPAPTKWFVSGAGCRRLPALGLGPACV